MATATSPGVALADLPSPEIPPAPSEVSTPKDFTFLDLMKAPLTWAAGAVALPVLLAFGAVSRTIERSMTANDLAVPSRFVSTSDLLGPFAFGFGAFFFTGFCLLAFFMWIWAARGSRGLVVVAVVATLMLSLCLYLALGVLSRADASYTTLYWNLMGLAMSSFVLLAAVISLGRRGMVAALTRWRRTRSKSRKTEPSRPSRWKLNGPQLTITEGRTIAGAVAVGFFVPVTLATLAALVMLTTAFGRFPATLNGVAPRDAYLISNVAAPRVLPDRVTLAFLDGSTVVIRPVARSLRDPNLFVPCGVTTIRDLGTLQLDELPAPIADKLRVGSSNPKDWPPGCAKPS